MFVEQLHLGTLRPKDKTLHGHIFPRCLNFYEVTTAGVTLSIRERTAFVGGGIKTVIKREKQLRLTN